MPEGLGFGGGGPRSLTVTQLAGGISGSMPAVVVLTSGMSAVWLVNCSG